jgi:hypothetical protein
LAWAGRQRFIQKAQRFSALRTDDASQVLYKAICRALGYSRNTTPFEILAGVLPLSLLERYAAGDPLKMLACIFGAAGMLPSQRPGTSIFPDDETCILEERWHAAGRLASPMAGAGWRLACVRPGNSPFKRLAGLSYLLSRFEDTGLLVGLALLIGAAPLKQASGILENCLVVKGDGYWARNYDFGRSHECSMALIGKGRAGEIVINAVLPFFWASARDRGDENLKRKISTIYGSYKCLPGSELTRYMQHELSIGSQEGLTACLQQGMLHIYHSWCRVKDCRGCPVATDRMPDRV